METAVNVQDTPQAEGRKPDKNLRGVISIIPQECYINPTWKGVVYAIFDLALYSVLFAALLMTDNPLLLVPLWVLMSLSVSALFILGHDACHGALFKNKSFADFFGRITMLPSLHAYSAWDLGHNRVHHSFTIKEESDFVWHPLSYEEYKELSPWGRMMHRIQWSAYGAGIYYLLEIWAKKMFFFKPPKKLAKNIKSDVRTVFYFTGFMFALFIAIGFYKEWTLLYSLWVPVKVLIIPWLMFNYIIGATVHIHHIQPDIPWHSHGVWNKFKGQVEGTTNFRIPKFFNVFFHNIFVHIPHHVDPRIPFYNLPKAADAIKKHYRLHVRDQPFSFGTYWKATRMCKLYDFEKKAWLNYRGEVVSVPTPAR